MNRETAEFSNITRPIRLTAWQQSYLKIKRVSDFCFSLVALVLLSPLFLLVAAALKLECPRDPVIFKQKRMGLHGAVFTIYKFRSMKPDAPGEQPASAFENAGTYITPLGRFLRSTSIDELPQLLNILKGEMSILGPRPLILAEEKVHRERLLYGVYQIRPGLSGLAQIHGRDSLNDSCKVLWDRRYAEQIGLRMDVSVFFQSIFAVLMHKDAVCHTDSQ